MSVKNISPLRLDQEMNWRGKSCTSGMVCNFPFGLSPFQHMNSKAWDHAPVSTPSISLNLDNECQPLGTSPGVHSPSNSILSLVTIQPEIVSSLLFIHCAP